MAKKPKMNGDLLTEEEWRAPFGLGYTMAADRLGLKYLMDPTLVLRLLLEFGNEAWRMGMTNKLPAGKFWKALNRKADELAEILKGKNPAYMATPWFTGKSILRATLYNKMEKARPADPPDAAWRKDPIRFHARAFMAFFPELCEGAIEGQGKVPNEQLAADHVRNYAGDFLGMDASMLSLNLTFRQSPEENEVDEDDEQL